MGCILISVDASKSSELDITEYWSHHYMLGPIVKTWGCGVLSVGSNKLGACSLLAARDGKSIECNIYII